MSRRLSKQNVQRKSRNDPPRRFALGGLSVLYLHSLIPNGLEASWLALAFLTPMLFNPASVRVFEPEKVAFIRATAMVMLALLIFRVVTTRGLWRDFRTRKPALLLPVFAVMLCILASSLLSDLPSVSLLGSYRRQFGAVTYLSLGVIFMAVATHLDSPTQAKRLVLAIALGSLIPCLYAVSQKLGVDPIPWSVDNSRRVVGTLGQPTFLGAYVASVLPASLWLFLQPGSRRKRLLFLVLVGLEALALLFSQSRGAWAGAAVGAGIVLAVTLRTQNASWKLGRPLIVGSGALALFVLALNLPGSPLGGFARSVPYLERLATFGDFESGSGRVRSVIWQTIPGIVVERPILGQGPDMMGFAFERHYPPELAYAENRTASADQAHNVFLQTLVGSGILGLVAYLWLVGAALVTVGRGVISLAVVGRPAWVEVGEASVGYRVPGTGEAWCELAQRQGPQDARAPRRSSTKRGNGPGVGSLAGETPALPAGERAGHRAPSYDRRLGGSLVLQAASPCSALLLGGMGAGLMEGMVGVTSASATLTFWLYLALASALAGRGFLATSSANVEAVAELPMGRYHRTAVSGGGDSRIAGLVQRPASIWILGLVVIVAACSGIFRLSILPLVADVRAAEASNLAAVGRYEEADRRWEEALAFSPDPEYWLLRGQMATEAVERSPGPRAEGWLLVAKGALAEAERGNPLDLDTALAQGKLHQDRAMLLGQEGEWQKAEASFRRAIALSPNRSYVRNRLGALFEAEDRHSDALAVFGESLRLDPGYAATYGFLGDSLAASGSVREAMDAYRKAEEFDPSLVLVHMNLAELHLRLGDAKSAAEEYEKAVQLSPADPALKTRLAEIRRSQP